MTVAICEQTNGGNTRRQAEDDVSDFAHSPLLICLPSVPIAPAINLILYSSVVPTTDAVFYDSVVFFYASFPRFAISSLYISNELMSIFELDVSNRKRRPEEPETGTEN